MLFIQLPFTRRNFEWCETPVKFKALIEFTEYFHLNVASENALNNLSRIFTNQAKCDVQFTFRDGQQIGAHRIILETINPALKAQIDKESSREVVM